MRSAVERGCFRLVHAADRWQGVLAVLRGIAEGMDHMHGKRICHSNLTPATVLLKVRLLQP